MTFQPIIKNPNAYNGEDNAMPDTQDRAGKKVFIETYGCQMNLADSELMGGVLAGTGFAAAGSLEDADVIIINTCAVRERAESRVFGRLTDLLRYKNDKPELVLGVAGCMAEHLREKIIDQAPYVDIVIGPDSYRRLPQLIDKTTGEATDPVIDIKLDKEEVYEGLTPKRAAGISGWVTVQRGCDKFCTFCIVPFVRGRERGVPPAEIIRQCEDMARRGYKEVTLLGQTVNSYRYEPQPAANAPAETNLVVDEHLLAELNGEEGEYSAASVGKERVLPSDEPLDFADLLELLVPIEGLERIRFTSPYPTDFTPKLIDTIARHEKICNYLHLPAQSGSTPMLEAMRRQYTRAEYDQLVRDIRQTIPDVALSTDIIVGFPGETDEDFEKTLELLRTTRFDFAYLFKYSERSNTFAARKLADDVPEDVKQARLERLISLQEEISAEIFASQVGQTFKVLVDGESRRDENDLAGRTDGFKRTIFPKPTDRELKAGDIVHVRITDSTSHTLLGEFVEPD